jgi:predicted extracellular nuclease
MFKRATSVLFIVLLVLTFIALPAYGAPTAPTACAGLFFSEYVEGSSNNKALEIYNGTGAAVDLAAEGYRVEFYFNGSATAGAIIPLTGAVANGDVYVLADNDAAAPVLAAADQTDAANFFNGDDAVILRRGSAVVDVIGQVGVDPGTAWGSGMTSTVDHTLRRKGSVGAGDPDGSNPFDPAAEWDGYDRNTFDGMGQHTAACFAPPAQIVINELDADTPGADAAEFIELYSGAGNTPLDGLTVVLFNGGNDASYAAYDLDGYRTDAAGYFTLGNPGVTPAPGLAFPNGTLQNGADAAALYRADASAFPNGTPVTTANLLDALTYDTADADDPGLLVLLNPGQPQVDEAGAGNSEGQSIGRCPNGAGGARNTSSYLASEPSPGAANACPGDGFGACGDPATFVHAIQGSGAVSPLVGSVRVVEGQVVGDFQDPATGLGGFFLQEDNLDMDADPATSEGIFIYDNGFGVYVDNSNRVRVRGTVAEYQGLTELIAVDRMVICAPSATTPVTPVFLPVASPDAWEAWEGMVVAFNQLTVAEVYNLGRYGEITLAHGGRPVQFTQTNAPSVAGYAAYVADLALRTVTLDDGNAQQNRDPILYPDPGLTAANTLRVGDTVRTLTAIVDQRFGNYRLQPEGLREFMHFNPRPAAPAGAGLRVMSFNVLNYFNGDGVGGGFPTPRGANTPSEFARQRVKIIDALASALPDVAGLIELENDAGPLSAQGDLAAGLNARLGAGTYALVDTGVLGGDQIKVGLIYRPAAVTPVGPWMSDADPVWSRVPLAQVFQDNATGERFTVVVNHFKSKGCDGATGADLDQNDGQGCYNARRMQQAQRLVQWVAGTVIPAAGDSDVLLIGDYNAYALEDPIAALRTAGYSSLTPVTDYSYVFSGQSGSLDHALASAGLLSQVAGADVWHINADEPRVLDYNEEFKTPGQLVSLYSPDAYRSSDHDPLVVRLQQGQVRTLWLPVVQVQR